MNPRTAIARRLLHRRNPKAAAELGWWSRQARAEGELHHAHYARLFTEPFGLSAGDFRDLALLDVGCGPRGSLEWATGARERVGLDPLAGAYRRFGTARHAMRYVTAPAESIPFPDGSFDVVSSLNALDHCEDAARAAAEMVRVLRHDGRLLLIVEVNHPPTASEPLTLGWDAISLFGPRMRAERVSRLARTHPGIHECVLLEPRELADPVAPGTPGILVARLRKRS